MRSDALTEEVLLERIQKRILELSKINSSDHIEFVRIVEYKGSRSKIELHCKKHDIYWRTSYGGLFTRDLMGCKKCTAEFRGNRMRMSVDEFIKRSREIHGNKYDYSLVKPFKNTTSKVTIVCPTHGSFEQIVMTHLLGGGCPKCFFDRDKESRFARNRERFFREAPIKFNNKYDYSKVEYKTMRTPVCIVCPEHGEFWQTPDWHLNYAIHGCPECARYQERLGAGVGEEEWTIRVIDRIKQLNSLGYNIELVGFKLLDDQVKLIGSSRVILHCNIHNITWEGSVTGFIHAIGPCCPECYRLNMMSIGERQCYTETLKYRKLENIFVNYQIKFDNSVGFSNATNTIIPDIYIREENISDKIIEFDGCQHYEYEPHLQENGWNFIKQVRRDQFLQDYCREHNITLLRIPWLDEKRIPEVIREFLVNGNDITTKVYPKISPVVII